MDGKRAAGILIRLERMRKDWSQDGLCKGICAVSYLSKIEQGKVQADSKLLNLLFRRLEKTWCDDEQILRPLRKLCEDLYEAFLSGDIDGGMTLLPALDEHWEQLICSPLIGDALALKAHWTNNPQGVPTELESIMDDRQRCLMALSRNERSTAWNLYPCAVTGYILGTGLYHAGDCTQALEYSQRAYDLAAREGAVRLMMFCQLTMGNCYSNLGNLEQMAAHNRVACRIAKAIGDADVERQVRYNVMSTEMELGRFEDAFLYFSALADPELLELHKLAICCEKLGKRTEALTALDRAEGMEADHPVYYQMCRIVRIRLETADYLHNEAYGTLLLRTFDAMCQELPKGYAKFHLPWVEEWMTANRRYREAYELVRDFTK